MRIRLFYMEMAGIKSYAEGSGLYHNVPSESDKWMNLCPPLPLLYQLGSPYDAPRSPPSLVFTVYVCFVL